MDGHPDELLEAFALDALEDDEHLQVEQHLDGCVRCRGYVAQLHQTTSGLGLFLDQSIPPAAIGLRIRQALTEVELIDLSRELMVTTPLGNKDSHSVKELR